MIDTAKEEEEGGKKLDWLQYKNTDLIVASSISG